MNKGHLRRSRVLKLLPLPAIVIAAAVLLFTWGAPGESEVSADAGHAGLNFAIGVDGPDANTTDDCNSQTGPFKCTFALSSILQVRVYLLALPTGVPSYEGFDILLNYSQLTSNNNSDANVWPNCAFEAIFYGVGFNSVGCGIGISAAASTFTSSTGPIATSGFTCPASNAGASVTMVHGPGSTELTQVVGSKHSEGSGGTVAAPESLSVNCGNPPTPTRTPTPTFTVTNTPTKTFTPTITRTPTVTPTPSNTPTPTPLPADRADVTITKTDSPDPVAPGGLITYSLLVTNRGIETATGITVTDTLPPEVVFKSASSPGATCPTPVGNTVQCQLSGDLALNEQVKITITVNAHTPAADDRIKNEAEVFAANELIINQGNNIDNEETVVLGPRPDLTLRKVDTGYDPVESQSLIVYTLTAENTGPEKAADVVIKDNLPAGADYVDGSSSLECDEPLGGPGQPDDDVGELDVICDVGSLNGQTSVQIAVTAPLRKRDAIILNRAFVSSSNELFMLTGNNKDTESTVILAPDPDLVLEKSGPAKVLRVTKYSYTLTVRNIGLGDALNVSVTDTLPQFDLTGFAQKVTFQSTSGATCPTPVAGSQKVACTIAEVPGNGGQVAITINVRAPTVLDDTVLQNSATASDPDEPGENPVGNTGMVNTTIQACYDTTGDGLVRIVDVLAVVDHYFSPSTYDLLYDFDGNGVVNITDVIAVLNHYTDDCV